MDFGSLTSDVLDVTLESKSCVVSLSIAAAAASLVFERVL